MITEKDILDGFNSGFDCSMQVAAELSGDIGITREQALRLMACFGVGAGQRSFCGAVSAAIMALGYRYGNTEPGDIATKGMCISKREEFFARFRKEFGALTCDGIMGVDLTTPDGSRTAREQGLVAKKCPKACLFAIETVRELLGD